MGIRHLAEQPSPESAAQNTVFDLNCAVIMSDDEERYNVSLLSHSYRMMLISFSLKARPEPQQRFLAKDIFGSDSELSDAPDAEGK